MSVRERSVLKAMGPVLAGTGTQVEAAATLGLTDRQVRRILRRIQEKGDGGVVHGLRGRPSNRRKPEALREQVLALCGGKYVELGPTMACEKLQELHGLEVSVETVRLWKIAAGQWTVCREHERHRQRRPRRDRLGSMAQADASPHPWLGDRGPRLVLVGMIDDATDQMLCRFYPAETTFAYMDLLRRWLLQHGRPLSWYCDRSGIFRAEALVPGYGQKRSVLTQFGRALMELDIELILAGSPQAKGRIERLWCTAQDRLVKELALAGACTLEQANAVLEATFLPWFNRHCTHAPTSESDAHRGLEGLNVDSILSERCERVVANDYTFRLENTIYQLPPPPLPGLRGGRVVIERWLNGSLHILFKGQPLPYTVAAGQGTAAATAPGLCPGPRSLARGPIPAGDAKGPAEKAGPPAVHRTGGRSGRTPALPCPSASVGCDTAPGRWRPAPDHPWRKGANA